MIPLNSQIQIEPEEHKDFIASTQTTYEEIGTIVMLPYMAPASTPLKVGMRVFFDSWMASKFPMEGGKYYWYVPHENIKAYEPLSEEQLQRRVSAQIPYSEPTESGATGAV